MTSNKPYVGISGLVLPFSKSEYPPEFQDKSRLEFYASIFNSIEINSSFYKLPMASTVAKWATLVPEDFRFTFKLSKSVTHNKELLYDPADIRKFMEVVGNIGNRKGCILIQFPPSLDRIYIRRLHELLTDIDEADPEKQWQIAVEFRNPSWYQQGVYELLEQHEAHLVVHDIPRSATPPDDYESDLVYLRFHGPEGRYRGSYAEDLLHEYSTYIRDWIQDGKQVYYYFNNTAGDAARNAMTLLNREA